MRSRKTLDKREAAIEFVPYSITGPLDFRQLFSEAGPVEIDAGCGDGTFLVALAARNPQRNFLGIERLPGRVGSVCRKAASLNLANVRVVHMDATDLVSHLLAPATISAFHLLFPDPWPKRKHHRRRAITKDFIRAIHRVLLPDGFLHIATDHAEYFRQIEHLLSPGFATSGQNPSFPQSAFEQRFAVSGAPIYRLLLRKISLVR